MAVADRPPQIGPDNGGGARGDEVALRPTLQRLPATRSEKKRAAKDCPLNTGCAASRGRARVLSYDGSRAWRDWPGAVDRLLQYRQPAAGPRRGSWEGNRSAPMSGRESWSRDPTIVDRKPVAGRNRRRCWTGGVSGLWSLRFSPA